MPHYDAVKDLALTVERVELEQLALPLGFMTRRTTVIHLHGAGEEGVGEDVTYEEEHHGDVALPDLSGEHTLDSFSALIGEQPNYRPWGLESAALDLALRQAGRSLAEAVGRDAQPVRFVVSQRKVRELLALYPDLRFKLDALDAWTDEIVAASSATSSSVHESLASSLKRSSGATASHSRGLFWETTKVTGRGARPTASTSERPAWRRARSSAADSSPQRR